MLSAGRYRQRVTLMRKTRTVDGDGNNRTAWKAVGAPIRAEVLAISGREAIIGRALQGVQFFEITIRYRTDIDDDDQLAFGALTLNVRSALDVTGRRRELKILADTGSAEATAP